MNFTVGPWYLNVFLFNISSNSVTGVSSTLGTNGVYG